MGILCLAACAHYGSGKIAFADSAIAPTFTDYIDFDQCTPVNIEIQMLDFEFIRVVADIGIIVAKPTITMTNGISRAFSHWQIGTWDSGIPFIEWYYKSLPVQKGMQATMALAVYGKPSLKNPKIDAWKEDLMKTMHGWEIK